MMPLHPDRYLSRCLLGLILLSFTPSGTNNTDADRIFLTGTWDLVGGVSASSSDQLLDPLLLAGWSDAIYVYDYGDYKLKAFSWDGALKWSFGRAGRGPEEFTNPTDLQVDGEGWIWVFDPATGRITIVSPDGKQSRFISVSRPIRRIVPLTNGRFLGMGSAQQIATVFDSTGEAVQEIPLPPELQDIESFAQEVRATPIPGGEGAVATFLYSDAWLRISPDTANVFHGVETLPFPEVLHWKVGDQVASRLDPQARTGAYAASVRTGIVFVLFGGKTENAGRIVDGYRLGSGQYLGSYLLPEKAIRIQMTSGVLMALIADPLPAVRIWRRRPGK